LLKNLGFPSPGSDRYQTDW